MALRIFWSKKALNNFDKILEYLEKEFGETVTRAFAVKVHSFVDNLQDFPELGVLQNSEKQIRGFVIVKQVTIFYRIFDDHIRILNLFDNRQNPKKK
ncbi:MAG: type II toxin-antitoxin system RelE/ParE family toxin [Cytophagaceae bacterium]|nr:type II toxin-antitoxin system RelE/ParE family toxin [Cytophagaceae bacterium]